MPHDDLTPWHAQLNADVKLFSPRVMAVRNLDDQTATCDALVKFIEFFGSFLHSRAIGVIYRPETELISHYFHARLPVQFDAILHYDHTRAVEPLERTAE